MGLILALILMAGGLPPDFSLSNAAGHTERLSKYKGKVVVVDFWATWCHGCKEEIPWFMEFQKKYKRQGLAVIGVSMDEDGRKSVKPYAKDKRMNYPVVIGSDGLAKQYGLENMPMTVLVGRDGRVVSAYSGMVDKDKFEREIVTALSRPR